MSTPALRPSATRTSALLDRYRTVRAATLALIAPLSPEDLMVQSCPEASPAKWHLAHTSWFFETFVLRDFLAGYQDFHPDFHWLFNSYYNSLGDMPAKNLRASFSRPPLADILAYRTHVDAAIGRLLESRPISGQRRSHPPHRARPRARAAAPGTHRHRHQARPLHQPAAPRLPRELRHLRQRQHRTTRRLGFASPRASPKSASSPIPGSADSFCFDNETPRHTVFIAPFSLATRPVTCAEYLAFMDDNGYTRPELWLSEGWTTVREQNWQAPLYWQRDPATASGWRIFTLLGWQSLADLSETPVCHLSLFEAAAYAQWASRQTPGARLPTEFEWEYAAAQLGTLLRGAPQPTELLTYPQKPGGQSMTTSPWAGPTNPGTAIAASRANILETGSLHPTRASSLSGLQQIYGDVWEWTSSAYTGYPGYHPLPGALGEYNGKFMSSQMVLRGGSCVTPATHIRATYRNFFSPATRWQFSGLRLARDGA